MGERGFPVSGLLTVYWKVDPAHFARALESIAWQSTPLDELVIVEDGPLPAGLRAVLDDFHPDFPMRIISLPSNIGSGLASQAGLAHVRSPWIARFDADDVSEPNRLERQVLAIRASEASGEPVDALGAAMAEFEDHEECVWGVRTLPATHEAIVRYALLNSPINNPTLLVRADAVKAIGGYRDVPLMEDYDLFVRLIAAGFRLANLSEALVRFRANGPTFARRTGLRTVRAEIRMQQTLCQEGLIRWYRVPVNLSLRLTYRLLPGRLVRLLHSQLFHQNQN